MSEFFFTKEMLAAAKTTAKHSPALNDYCLNEAVLADLFAWSKSQSWQIDLAVLRKRAGLAEPIGANFNVDKALADLRKRLRYVGTGPTGNYSSSSTLCSNIGDSFWVHILPPIPPACESSDSHELGHVELGDVDAHTIALAKVKFD